jgi:hypothetical protein
MSLNEEGLKKVARMKEVARKQFDRLSVLSDAVRMEEYDPHHHQGEFIQLPYRPLMPIRDFNDPNTFMDLVFGEIGRGLAFSETKFLTEHLAASSETVKVEKTPLSGVLDFINSLKRSGRYQPSIVFAPIDYYIDWYDDLIVAARKNLPFKISTAGDEKSYLMFPDGAMMRWFWSNKYAPFDDFYIIDKNWARWIFKRSTEDGQRFQITISQTADKLDIIFRLVFKLEVLDTNAIRRFTPLHVHKDR